MGLARSLRRPSARRSSQSGRLPNGGQRSSTPGRRSRRRCANSCPALRDEDLARNVEFAIGGTDKRIMPVGELLQHAANHGAHHRGQVSLRLRLLGFNPDNYDMLFYFAEKRRSQA